MNITLYTGEIKPRTVQKLRREGFISAVIPTDSYPSGLHLLEDIDGSKLIALFSKENAPSIKEADVVLQKAFDELADLPVIKIEGEPEEVIPDKFDGLYVSKSNIVLTKAQQKDELILEFYETVGQETDCEFVCANPEFGFRALFQPWEIKRFYISSDGTVQEKI
ncbi:MAG: hypothetical protein J1E34_07715 [Oscillospiraceae bacterium]|nr:hypothetical protein [Oscillospiraceae bacterium]